MKISEEFIALYKDMKEKCISQEKFTFTYNQINFKVIVLIDRTPFEFLFGVVNHNFSFILNMRDGFIIDHLTDDVFYKLCKILNLKPGKETFTSNKFLEFFAARIPPKCSGKKVQPHEIVQYKHNEIPESEKKYFYGWGLHIDDGRKAQNFEKTRVLLGKEACAFCKAHNISSWWTADASKRKDYYPPNEYKGKM